MGYAKEEKSKRVIRAIKTVFFLITLLISFLFFSAPVLLAVADTILPSALLSASSPFLSPQSLSSHFANYDFRYSLVDIPLISILRSLVIICKFFIPLIFFDERYDFYLVFENIIVKEITEVELNFVNCFFYIIIFVKFVLK